MSEFNSLIRVVSCAEILCWSFLECINYFSFNCRSVAGVLMISYIIRPNGQQLSKPIVSYDNTYVA